MSNNKRYLPLLILMAIVSACNESIPDYFDMQKIDSRADLLEKFGEPDSVVSYPYLPDVISIGEPSPAYYSRVERWAYSTVKDGVHGKALFTFYTNKSESNELLGYRDWLDEQDFASLKTRDELLNDPRYTWIGN